MSDQVTRILDSARTLLGVPYQYGASMDDAPKAFDCSGFTKYVFAQANTELPRSTILQATHGKVVTQDEMQPGDLIFLRGTRGFYNEKFPEGIGHVMIYAGDGKVIHARSARTKDYPEVIEEVGEVVEASLQEELEQNAPLITIKRIL